MKIKISKSQWELAGKKAGWIKTSMREMRELILDLDSMELLEQLKKDDLVANNIWMISYNKSTFEDTRLLSSLSSLYGNTIKFIEELFKAANVLAKNSKSGQTMTAEVFAKKIFPDIDYFWEAIKQNDSIYDTERSIEKRDVEMGDDQALGDYEKYGPDQQKPQF
jgi:hypothetical protein